MSRSPFILAALASLMGASGIGLAAAGAHQAGGELAERGALFLLIHAAAALAIAAFARAGAAFRALVIVGFVMEAGACLFSAELAMRAFTGDRLFPFAAPIGGTTMMGAWVALAVVMFAAAGRRS